MGSSKPKVVQQPFQQTQQQTNSFAPFSIAGTPEAKSFLEMPLDFGEDVNVDPGVGRRTDLAEQEVDNRWNSAFNMGIPAWIRNMQAQKEKRDIQAQGAYEAQNAQYLNQQGNNARRSQRTMSELERRRLLLPQMLQTGGSSNASGYSSQAFQQPSIWNSIIGGAAQVGSAAIPFI